MSKAITSCKKALAYLLTAAMVLGMAVTSPITAVEVKAANSGTLVPLNEYNRGMNADATTAITGLSVAYADADQKATITLGSALESYLTVTGVSLAYTNVDSQSVLDEYGKTNNGDQGNADKFTFDKTTGTTVEVEMSAAKYDGTDIAAVVYYDYVNVSGEIVGNYHNSGESIATPTIGSDGVASIVVTCPGKTAGKRAVTVTAKTEDGESVTVGSPTSENNNYTYSTENAIGNGAGNAYKDVKFYVEFADAEYTLTLNPNSTDYVFETNLTEIGSNTPKTYKLTYGQDASFKVKSNEATKALVSVTATKGDGGSATDYDTIKGNYQGNDYEYVIPGTEINDNITVTLEEAANTVTWSATSNSDGSDAGYDVYKVRKINGSVKAYEKMNVTDGVILQNFADTDVSFVVGTKKADGSIEQAGKNDVTVWAQRTDKYDAKTQIAIAYDDTNKVYKVPTADGTLGTLANDDTGIEIIVNSGMVEVKDVTDHEVEDETAKILIGLTGTTELGSDYEILRGKEFVFRLVPETGRSIDELSVKSGDENTSLGAKTGMQTASATTYIVEKLTMVKGSDGIWTVTVAADALIDFTDTDNVSLDSIKIAYKTVGKAITTFGISYKKDDTTGETAYDFTSGFSADQYTISAKVNNNEILTNGSVASPASLHVGDVVELTLDGADLDENTNAALEVTGTYGTAKTPIEFTHPEGEGDSPIGYGTYIFTILDDDIAIKINKTGYKAHNVSVKIDETGAQRIPSMKINERAKTTASSCVPGKEYLVYENNGAQLTVSAPSGCEIESVTARYVNGASIAENKITKSGETYTIAEDDFTNDVEFTVKVKERQFEITETETDDDYKVYVRAGETGDYKAIGTSKVYAGPTDSLYFKVMKKDGSYVKLSDCSTTAYDANKLVTVKLLVGTETTSRALTAMGSTDEGYATDKDYVFKIAADDVTGNVKVGADAAKRLVYDTRNLATGFNKRLVVVAGGKSDKAVTSPNTDKPMVLETEASVDKNFEFYIGIPRTSGEAYDIIEDNSIKVSYIISNVATAPNQTTMDGLNTALNTSWTEIKMDESTPGKYVIDYLKDDAYGEHVASNLTASIYIKVESKHSIGISEKAEEIDAVYYYGPTGTTPTDTLVKGGTKIKDTDTKIEFDETKSIFNDGTKSLFVAVKDPDKYAGKVTASVNSAIVGATPTPVTITGETGDSAFFNGSWKVYKLKVYRETTSGSNVYEYIPDLSIAISKEEVSREIRIVDGTDRKNAVVKVTDEDGNEVEGTVVAGTPYTTKYTVKQSGTYTVKLTSDMGDKDIYGTATLKINNANNAKLTTVEGETYTWKVENVSNTNSTAEFTVNQTVAGHTLTVARETTDIATCNAKYNKYDGTPKVVTVNGGDVNVVSSEAGGTASAGNGATLADYIPTGNITVSWSIPTSATKKLKEIVIYNDTFTNIKASSDPAAKIIERIPATDSRITGTTIKKIEIPATKDIKCIYLRTEDDPEKLYNVSFEIDNDADVVVKANDANIEHDGDTFLGAAVNTLATVTVKPNAGYTAKLYLDGIEQNGTESSGTTTYNIPAFTSGKTGVANKKVIRVETEGKTLTKKKYFYFDGIADGLSVTNVKGADLYDEKTNEYVAGEGASEVTFDVLVKKGTYLKDITNGGASTSIRSTSTGNKRVASGDNWKYSFKIVLTELSGGSVSNDPKKISLGSVTEKVTVGATTEAGASGTIKIGDGNAVTLSTSSADNENIAEGTEIVIKASEKDDIYETINEEDTKVAFTRDEETGEAVFTFTAHVEDNDDYIPTATERTFVIKPRKDLEEYRAYLVDSTNFKKLGDGENVDVPYATTAKYNLIIEYIGGNGDRGDASDTTAVGTETRAKTVTVKATDKDGTTTLTTDTGSVGGGTYYKLNTNVVPKLDTTYEVKLIEKDTPSDNSADTEKILVDTELKVSVTDIARTAEIAGAVEEGEGDEKINVVRVKASGNNVEIPLVLKDTKGEVLTDSTAKAYVTATATNKTGRKVTAAYSSATGMLTLKAAKGAELLTNKEEILTIKDNGTPNSTIATYTLRAVAPRTITEVKLSDNSVNYKPVEGGKAEVTVEAYAEEEGGWFEPDAASISVDELTKNGITAAIEDGKITFTGGEDKATAEFTVMIDNNAELAKKVTVNVRNRTITNVKVSPKSITYMPEGSRSVYVTADADGKAITPEAGSITVVSTIDGISGIGYETADGEVIFSGGLDKAKDSFKIMVDGVEADGLVNVNVAARDDEPGTPADEPSDYEKPSDSTLDINDDSGLVITASKEYTYTGKPIQAAVKVSANPNKLVNGVDYKITYADNVNAGKGKILVSGINQYSGLLKDGEIEFTIKPKKASGFTVVAGTMLADEAADVVDTKDDDAVDGKISVYDGTRKLTIDEDYTIESITRSSNGKKLEFVIKGAGNYDIATQKKASIAIVDLKGKKDIAACTVEDIAEQPFTGSAIKPDVKVTGEDGKPASYTVTYKNNKNVGVATVTIKGKGDYAGSIVTTFNIISPVVEEDDVVITVKEMTYTGKLLKPSVKVQVPVGGKLKTLSKNKDYVVYYGSELNAGTGRVIIRGIGNYEEILTDTPKEFTIKQADFKKVSIKKDKSTKRSGIYFNNKKLVEGEDFEVISSVKNGDKYTVTIQAADGSKNFEKASKTKVIKGKKDQIDWAQLFGKTDQDPEEKTEE